MTDPISQAARILAHRRQTGEVGPRLPEDCRPADIETALAVQKEVTRSLGESIGGWKCAMPSKAGPVVAPIHAGTVVTQGVCSAWAEAEGVRVEPELAFVFGRDLPARDEPYQPAEIDAAIASAHLALEVIHQRFDETAGGGFAEKLADGLVNQGLFLGPQVDAALAAKARELAIRVTSDSGGAQDLAGQHPAGDPLAPLYWLVEFLRSRGDGIRAGQAVITGSYAGSFTVPVDEVVRVRYGDLGEWSVRFTARRNP